MHRLTLCSAATGEQKEPAWELFAIRQTTCQMLQDRGYALPPEDAEDFTFESFLQRWNGKVHKDLTILGEKPRRTLRSPALAPSADGSQDCVCMCQPPMWKTTTRESACFFRYVLSSVIFSPCWCLGVGLIRTRKICQRNPPEARTRKLTVDIGATAPHGRMCSILPYARSSACPHRVSRF